MNVSLENRGNSMYKFVITLSMILILFFDSDSLWVSSSNNKTILLIFYIVFILLSIMIVNRFNKFNININGLISVTFLIFFILLSMIINQSFSLTDFTILIYILLAILIVSYISFYHFVKLYILIITIITLYSLILMYMILPIFPEIKTIFPSFINDAGLLVRNYIFTFHFEDHIAGSKRNTGIFREMGVFQFHINIAIIFLWFTTYFNKFKILISFILIIGLITTFSSAGYITFIIILISFLFKQKKLILGKMNIKNFTLISFILCLILIFLNLFTENILTTFERITIGSSSFDGRVASIIANIKSWENAPFFGHGIKGADIFAYENYLKSYTKHNTSTTTSFFSFYGLIPGILFVWFTFLFAKQFKQNFISTILIFISIMFSINSQRFNFDQLFYILLFTTFMYRGERNG